MHLTHWAGFGGLFLARKPEDIVARAIERECAVVFPGSLTLGTWGNSDRFARLGKKTKLILEVEFGQKHPCTNILKLWPYMEDNPQDTVLFVHAFFDDSAGRQSNRGRLATWLGKKMMNQLGDRFKFVRVVLNRDGSFANGLEALRSAVAAMADLPLSRIPGPA
jgi:hypothetical protein